MSTALRGTAWGNVTLTCPQTLKGLRWRRCPYTQFPVTESGLPVPHVAPFSFCGSADLAEVREGSERVKNVSALQLDPVSQNGQCFLQD